MERSEGEGEIKFVRIPILPSEEEKSVPTREAVQPDMKGFCGHLTAYITGESDSLSGEGDGWRKITYCCSETGGPCVGQGFTDRGEGFLLDGVYRKFGFGVASRCPLSVKTREEGYEFPEDSRAPREQPMLRMQA